MDKSLFSRLESLEAAAGLAAKTHIVWISEGDDPDPTAAISRLIEKGRAKAGDRFYTASWHPAGEPESPMAGDLDPFTAAPKPAPAPPEPPAWSPGGSPLEVPAVTPLPDNDWGGSSWFWGRDVQP